MFRLPAIAALALTLFGSSAIARLGENEIECADRYGGAKEDKQAKTFPFIPGAPHRAYHFKGWVIRCAFIDGVVAREEYKKVIAPGVSPTMADFEIAAILEGEARNDPWQEFKRGVTLNLQAQFEQMLKDTVGERIWVCSDGSFAILRPIKMAMLLETPAAATADTKYKKQQEDKQRAAVPKF